jgi:hypothetical protein
MEIDVVNKLIIPPCLSSSPKKDKRTTMNVVVDWGMDWRSGKVWLLLIRCSSGGKERKERMEEKMGKKTVWREGGTNGVEISAATALWNDTIFDKIKVCRWLLW